MQLMIRDLAFAERPRERLLAVGVEGLKDEELLALVLRTGYRGHNAVEVARALLTEYTLPSLLHLPAARLARLRGMGLSRAATLLAAAELIRRSQTQPPAGRVETVNDVMAQSLDIRDKKKEYLLAFFLNARHLLIAKAVISIATLTAALAHPR
jgi:DNA repair protein RadC